MERRPPTPNDPAGPCTVPQACARARSDVIRAGYRTKWCHLLILNAAYNPLLDNWLCRAQELGLFDLLQSTVFVSTEPSVHTMLQTQRLKHVASWNVSGAGELLFRTSHYFILMATRLHLIKNLLHANVSVLITEVDQALCQDPLRAVDSLTGKQDFSFVSYDDSPDKKKNPCFGFMGLRPSAALLAGWDRMTAETDRRPQNEQLLFQKILKDPHANISHVFLDGRRFWSGHTLRRHAPPFPTGLVMVHANWVVGLKAKIDLMRDKGLYSQNCATPVANAPGEWL